MDLIARGMQLHESRLAIMTGSWKGRNILERFDEHVKLLEQCNYSLYRKKEEKVVITISH